MSLLNTLGRLWRFHGGVHLPEHKQESTGLPITVLAAAGELVLPLQQHIGAPARACVQVGQPVAKGEVIARADGYVSVPLHAPTSGTVLAIEPRPIAHPSGIDAPAIVLAADGRDAWHPGLPLPLEEGLALDPAVLRARVRESGIVGLGGAAFPTAVKLNLHGRIQVLILNAAECEPYLTCDDVLMRERAREVIGGLLLMRRALDAGRCLIGIEDNKPEAAAALEAALHAFGGAATGVELRVIPTLYPSGGEQQLIRVLTGVEVARSRRPVDSGILCQNVGTAAAVHAAVTTGRPLISRIVTITGAGVASPRNLEVAFGTPVRALVEACGGYTERAQRLILGGPMMGLAVAGDEVPVTKGMGCVLVAAADELAPPAPTLPCIRCGSCMDACPANLLPQQLYWFAHGKEFDKAQATRLFDCIECGACAAVCPSRLPLVQYYRYAKSEIGAAEREKQKSEQARRRHEFRTQRLEREEAERLARQQAKKARATAPAANEASASAAAAPDDDPKKAAIAAALARAQEKKAAKVAETGTGTAPPATASPAAPAAGLDEAQLAKLAAARARAEAKKAAQAAAAAPEAMPAAAEAASAPAAPAPAPAMSEEQLAKLAAARARAEAKKAAQAAPAAPEAAPGSAGETPAPAAPALSEEQLAKLAAARARAEAKKAAQAAPAAREATAVAAAADPAPAAAAAPEAVPAAAEAAPAPGAPALSEAQLAKLAAARARAEAKKAAQAVCAPSDPQSR